MVSRGLVSPPAGRIADWIALAGPRNGHSNGWRRSDFYDLGARRPDPRFTNADFFRRTFYRRRFGRRGALSWLPFANFHQGKPRLARSFSYVSSLRGGASAESQRGRGFHFHQHGTRRHLAGRRLPAHADAVVSTGRSLGVELGSGRIVWSAG